MAKGDYRSRVYTDRPSYADLEPYDKFQAIQGIIITRLRQHPNAICSYSGGADSDIMIDLKVGIIEADGGMWEFAARRNVKEYLEKAFEKEISDGSIVVAL